MRAGERVVFRMHDGELIAGRIAEAIRGVALPESAVGCAAPWLLMIDLHTHVLMLRGVPGVGWWTLGGGVAELVGPVWRVA